MPAIEIKKGVYWVGAFDWDLRLFEGPIYHTPNGVSYNAYLIIDDEITLVDSVESRFFGEMLEKIESLTPISKIDHVIINHVEPDHSGAFPDMMKLMPSAKIHCTQKAKEALLKYYYGEEYDYNVVKTGDVLNIGKRNLHFIESRMLHWPDNMMTFVPEDKLLLSNDAFGQHLASSHLFDDENDMEMVMREAKTYYANILMPFAPLLIRKIEEIQKMDLDMDMIAPSHGVVFRKDPGRIIDAYLKWAKPEMKKKAIIIYETMYESTMKMARAIVDGLSSEDIEVKLYKADSSDFTSIFSEIVDAKALLIGSSTFNNGMIPQIGYFLEELVGLKPRGKIGAAFGSYGWGKGAVKKIEARMKEMGADLVEEGLEIQYAPSGEELKACYEYGKSIGKKIQESCGNK